jgi:hypothetical protein
MMGHGANESERRPDVVDAQESRMNRIARRAHEIYEARGGEHGRALEDWLQAEREIDAESSDQREHEQPDRH